MPDVTHTQHHAACGCTASDPATVPLSTQTTEDGRVRTAVENTLLRAVLPDGVTRRGLIKTVGRGAALAAIAKLLPVDFASEVFAADGAVEKKDLKIGFIPITCATPIIMAAPMGFYSKHGLNVEAIKTAN